MKFDFSGFDLSFPSHFLPGRYPRSYRGVNQNFNVISEVVRMETKANEIGLIGFFGKVDGGSDLEIVWRNIIANLKLVCVEGFGIRVFEYSENEKTTLSILLFIKKMELDHNGIDDGFCVFGVNFNKINGDKND
jgi:hypothetical protein